MKLKPVSVIRAAAISIPLLLLLNFLVTGWGFYFPGQEEQIKIAATQESADDEFAEWDEEAENNKSSCSEKDDSCAGCPLSGSESKDTSTANNPADKNDTSGIENDTSSVDAAGEDEFEEFDEFDEFAPVDEAEEKEAGPFLSLTQIIKLGVSFILIILASVFVRRQSLRKYRIFFLLAGLVFFGFYFGGCPCPIMSFFKVFLVFRGEWAFLNGIVWIAGIVFLTYLLGKTWCGWICPLGALQEFLNRKGLFKLQDNKTLQKSLRIVRYLFIVFFSIWALLTGEILLSIYDPFKPVFNLFYGSVSIILWILIGIMLASSIVIYRPFCKTVCPLGVLLGWISKLPGATRIKIGEDCTDCVRCEKNCQMNAIVKRGENRKVLHEDCIFCGDCIDSCNKDCICP